MDKTDKDRDSDDEASTNEHGEAMGAEASDETAAVKAENASKSPKEGGRAKRDKPPSPPAVVAPRQYRAVRDSFANGRYYEKDKIYVFGAGDPVSEHFEALKK